MELKEFCTLFFTQYHVLNYLQRIEYRYHYLEPRKWCYMQEQIEDRKWNFILKETNVEFLSNSTIYYIIDFDIIVFGSLSQIRIRYTVIFFKFVSLKLLKSLPYRCNIIHVISCMFISFLISIIGCFYFIIEYFSVRLLTIKCHVTV